MSDGKYPGGTLGGVPLFNDENREFVTATNAWREVPIPRKMQALGKDRRGYPIPFNVLRNEEGRPHFTVNDSIRQHRALVEKRCAICGGRLGKPLWFVGGPLSAFHEDGAYMDTALHHECMTYALHVCPYLAVKNYNGRIDDATVDHSKLRDGMILMDPTHIPERPSLFVAVASNSQTIIPREGICPLVKPDRPYIAVEYWRNGKRLSEEDGHILLALAFTEEDALA